MPIVASTGEARGTILLGRKQATCSVALALIPIFVSLLLGLCLLVSPARILEHWLDCLGADSSSASILDVQLARLVGCVLLGQALSCLSLLHPMLTISQPLLVANPQDGATLDKFRSAVFSLATTGLLAFVGGLVDDRSAGGNGSCPSIRSASVMGTGAAILILACGSTMVSFWPPATTATPIIAREDGDLRTPLLVDEESPPEDPNDAATDHRERTTSRVRGTERLLKLAAPQVFYLYVGCAVLLVRLPFSLAIPHFVSTTLGALSRGDFGGARFEVLLLFILGTIDAALDFWCVFLFGYANLKIVRGVRIDTFVSILRQEVAFFDKTTSGELASRLNSDCGEMAGDLTWFFRFSIESVVRITGIVIYMLIRCPILGVCAIAIIPAVALVNKLYGNWLNKNATEVQDALASANEAVQESLSSIRTVIAFASEQQEYMKYKEKIDHHYNLNVRQLYITGVYYCAISTFLINTVVQGTLLLIGTALIQRGKLTGDVLLAFMLYQGQLQSETMNLFQSYTSLVKSSGAGDKVFEILDRRPAAPGTGSEEVLSSEVVAAELGGGAQSNAGQHQSADTIATSATEQPFEIRAISKPSCSVELSNIFFNYPTRPDNIVLKEFNLSIPQGKTVALVGASGCGKSTVVGLLQRYYDPAVGSILINGKDLRTLDVKQHRRRIGIVTQDPILFKGTVLSNIIYGYESASRADAIEAARLANALNFIYSFPEGFETDVGERGGQLSGGQKQRIAIARAIVRKPVLLLLDEATSALDAESEQAVQDALDTLLKTNAGMTTAIIVAHRLRTVRNADLIAFIDKGRVIEIGTHEELIKIPDGHYARMVAGAGSSGHLPVH